MWPFSSKDKEEVEVGDECPKCHQGVVEHTTDTLYDVYMDRGGLRILEEKKLIPKCSNDDCELPLGFSSIKTRHDRYLHIPIERLEELGEWKNGNE